MAYFNQTNYNSPRGQNENPQNENPRAQNDVNQTNYASPRDNYDQPVRNQPYGEQRQQGYHQVRTQFDALQQPQNYQSHSNAPMQYGRQQRHAQYDTRQPQQYNAPENQYTETQQYQGDPYGGGGPQISPRNEVDRYGRDMQSFRRAPEKKKYQEKGQDVQVIKNPKCGWFLFVRFHRNGFDDLKDSLSRTRTSTLRIHGGRVTGIALADQIHVNEGSDDWVLQTKFTRREGTWYRQQYNGKNDMCILVLGFHNFNDLESWIKRDNNFKQHDFPAQYGYEAFAAALNYVPANDKEYPTFLLTEYANVKDSDADAFREYAHNYTKVLERYCPMPYVIKTFGSQHIKGTWIKPKSIVTLSLFLSSRHVQAFFEDDDYKRIRFEQDRLSKTTSIYFTLTEFV